MAVDTNEESEGGISAKMRKIFANRKNLTTAERKKLDKERKARQLRRLRKLLTPKNAVVALHEMQGPGMGEFIINTNGHETTAEIVLNNVRYEATAPNKHLAKARASEKALRDLVISQMAKSRQRQESTNGNAVNVNANANANQEAAAAADEDTEMTDVSDSDDVPMLHLASYALYKLFNEWQNEGFEIPAIKPQKPSVKLSEAGIHPLAPKVAKTKADLPLDATTRHPTALLAFMRPQVPYEDLGTNNSNDPQKREFSVGVTVDGQRFIGKARSKKLARKEAASAACRTLFDVAFVETSAASPSAGTHDLLGLCAHLASRVFF
ncbi:double-stranded RNA-specific editase B2 isoform X3 [Sabethes cyaneus]|nr:double-stranded RNA-specific editase B2 isoform X3 [Sabethes cyaneus]XP_053683663.1 double-stranded RNA-specific editase B2 isoform X3 [Sabethes cyaneus]XP_053683742.1 double-stranded RNA-specific editase B2 isoform X3 [Sabethes cyaneus]XP_053683831.1 double-stranded RNA-specific editase B2 isoform X3 [Sabethes cyaneus]